MSFMGQLAPGCDCEGSGRLTPIWLLTVWTVAAASVAFASIYGLVFFLAHFPRPVLPSENSYRTATEAGIVTRTLPVMDACDDDVGEVFVSVVVPAYNEVDRLPGMLTEAVSVLREWTVAGQPVTWEILVVDDGSRDETAQVALRVSGELGVPEGSLRVCVLEKNRGKGGAVTHGMQRARGQYIIFADADGASQFSDIKALHDALAVSKAVADARIAVGSRAHMVKSEAVVKRSFIRNFLMYSLHTLLYVFGIRSIRDTQCGFKMFTRAAAREIFPYMHNEGWIFDVEILILAERKGMIVEEVPISWHEVPGSKMELARDSVQMAIDLVVIRCAYILGIYDDGSIKRHRSWRMKKSE